MLGLFKLRMIFLSMRKSFIIILFVLFSLCGYGQVRTVYFDVKDKVTTDSTKANSYAIYGKISGDSLWVFKKYDRDGYLLVTGSFKDDLLSIAQGKFVYYNWINPNESFSNAATLSQGKERYIVQSGNYDQGLRQGKWFSYYESGEIRNVVVFNTGVMSGEFKFFDENGKLQESGQFMNDKKQGTWILSGGLKVVNYENDQVISVVKKTKRELKKEQENKANGL